MQTLTPFTKSQLAKCQKVASDPEKRMTEPTAWALAEIALRIDELQKAIREIQKSEKVD